MHSTSPNSHNSKYKYIPHFFLASLLLSFCCNALSNEKVPSIACITPTDSRFWEEFRAFSSHVAEDLNIKFKLYPEVSAFNAQKLVKKIANSDNKPDYLIFRYLANAGHNMLAEAEAAGIRTIIVNNSVPGNERDIVGYPRQKLKHWIGIISPDEKQVGYDLAEAIIKEKKSQMQDTDSAKEPLELIAVAGDGASHVSVKRVEGLQQRANEEQEIKIRRIIDTHWSGEQAAIALPKLLNFYPKVSMIWGIGDHILIEGIDGAMAHMGDRVKSLSMGSIDATPDGVKRVIKGDISVTLGGHFIEGGWAVLLAHDHFHGIDFAHDPGTQISLPFLKVTSDNAQLYLKMFEEELWQQIDFSSYSKVHNPKLMQYDLSLTTLLKKISPLEETKR